MGPGRVVQGKHPLYPWKTRGYKDIYKPETETYKDPLPASLASDSLHLHEAVCEDVCEAAGDHRTKIESGQAGSRVSIGSFSLPRNIERGGSRSLGGVGGSCLPCRHLISDVPAGN